MESKLPFKRIFGKACFAILLAFWVTLGISAQGIAHFNTLTWILSPTPGVTSQKVYRGMVSGGPYTLISTIGNDTTTTYQDNSVSLGTNHCYVLTASVGASESPLSNEVCFIDKGTNVNPPGGVAVTGQ